ncbi:MAG: sulfatase-like hydrolase/transferase [Planctomycetes bacterium]|nr:sulfatase-like hydrolase/transferase [Planctomycetota bacterium]
MKKLLLLVTVLIATESSSFAEPGARPRVFGMPNVVVLLADDLGYGELGCQGNLQIPTPHIDAIAAEGVRFTAGYVTAPNCSPSRAGLLTGRYGTRFGHEFNPIGAKNEEPGMGLPLGQKTLAEALQKAGYITGVIGKWHLGGSAQYHPYRRGFDEFYGFLHEGHYFVPHPWKGVSTWLRRRTLPGGGKGRRAFGKVTYSTHMQYDEPDYDADNPILRGSQPVDEGAYLTDALTREAVDFIERHHDKPFFLFLAYNAVHSPLQGADTYITKFEHIEDIQRRIFAAMLANLDDSVGDIMTEIRRQGLENDTVIYFVSDNGGPTRELTSSNLPLRGEKGSMYEGGIRVPFMIQWPAGIPKGITYERPVITTDIFATTFAAAGLTTPAGKSDSVNLLPYIQGTKQGNPHESLYWRQGAKRALRKGNMKVVRQGSAWQLYDLSKDISEEADLAKSRHALLNDLVKEWERLDAQMVDAAFR